MEHTYSSRGFKQLDPIELDNRQRVRVYESSSAESPHIWLALTNGSIPDAAVNLTLDEATEVAAQLRWLIDHHYQVTPPENPQVQS